MRAVSAFARRLRRRLNGRRLTALHLRCLAPSEITLSALSEAGAMLGLSADDLIAGRVDGAEPGAHDARRFLDLTHPGHGLDFDVMPAGEVAFVAGVAAANFTTASVRRRLSQAATSTPSGQAPPTPSPMPSGAMAEAR